MSDFHWTIESGNADVRLDRFLSTLTCFGSRTRAQAALARGKIFLNGIEADLSQASVALAVGDVVRVWIDRPGSAKRPSTTIRSSDGLRIVFEDEWLVVVNKPAGLLVVPLDRRSAAPSVYELLGERLRSHKRRPFIVHRIDRDTSGLVVFAKDALTQQQVRLQFKRREPERLYLAIVYGHPSSSSGVWRDHFVWDRSALIQKQTHPRDPQAKEAVSEYRLAESFESTSLLQVRLRTGRRNQIRLQARLRGHTLVGEQRYVFGPSVLRPITFHRQALHAFRLGFRHPRDGRDLRFEAPLPADLGALLDRLRSTGAPRIPAGTAPVGR